MTAPPSATPGGPPAAPPGGPPTTQSPVTVIEGCTVATVDAAGTVHADGYVVLEGSRIAAVGAGRAPEPGPGARRVSGAGCLATPGLVNAHHHFSQWLTRGMATSSTLFEWLEELYPWWALVDAGMAHAGALGSLSALAQSGVTTTTDHHYVFPAGAGDALGAEIAAAGEVGLRFHPCRGSMDLGHAAGGLPPDVVVESTDAALEATEEAIRRWHDPAPDAMVRVAVAPCSPFSASAELMRGAAEIARANGVRMHTHLAETADEQRYCAERFGCSPAAYAESLGWLGEDVWLAHCVQLDAASLELLGRSGAAVAHCPSSNARLGAGTAPVPEMLAAGVAVGLGVDGSASNEAGSLGPEIRAALLAARARSGPRALDPSGALALATMGGARCLGRSADIGSLEPGKLADVALWRLDGAAHAGIADPVAALVLGAPAPLEMLTVGGRVVVERGQVVGLSDEAVAGAVSEAVAQLRRRRASGVGGAR